MTDHDPHANPDEERIRHGSSFGAVASAYAEHRPGYATDAVRWCLAPVWRPDRPPRVLDVGAGTGILTAALAGLGADVTAVEPDPAMLAEFRRHLPAVPAVAGRAERLPAPDASVDAVLAGQAMHWFDLDHALPELARVLVPGGVLAGLWNADDDRVPWVAALAERAKRKASVTLSRWRDGVGERQGRALKATGAFGQHAAAEFENGQVRTASSLLATFATHSHLLVMPQAERSSLLAGIAAFLAAEPATSGEFTLPMVTVALRVRRLG